MCILVGAAHRLAGLHTMQWAVWLHTRHKGYVVQEAAHRLAGLHTTR